ncbi:MAG: transglutaminase family protein [Solirubrobacteraceae bacterium]
MMLPFSLAAGLSCPTHADLAAALAAEFRPVDEAAVDAALGGVTSALEAYRDAPAAEQLVGLAAVMAAFEPVEGAADANVMLIDVALDRMAGHPTVLAVIAAEAAQRAGLAMAVIGGGRDLFVGPYARHGAAAFDPRRPGLNRLPDERCSWRCSHQVALLLLREYLDRALRAGDLAGALRAAELRLQLPLELWALRRLRGELNAVRARLN